VLDQSESDS
jgi:hypothetical protein